MNTHIVRVDEKIEKIASIYNLTTDEIIKINHHIRDWDHLIPGTKLRLPEIPEIIQTELDNTEPFIEEYYPKIELNEYLQTHNEQEILSNVNQPLEQNLDDNASAKMPNNDATINKPKKYPTYNPYYYNNMSNPYYGYHPNYYYNYYQRLRKKNNKKPKV